MVRGVLLQKAKRKCAAGIQPVRVLGLAFFVWAIGSRDVGLETTNPDLQFLELHKKKEGGR